MFLVPVLTRRKNNGRRFERDSVNSRLDSFMSFTRSLSGVTNEKPPSFGVSGTKSGLRTNERLAQKRQLVHKQSTIYSEKELSIDNTSDVLRSSSGACDIGKRAPRERSISFASDKDPAEPDEMFIYEPSYEYDIFDNANFSDGSSSSSGCFLGNSFNTSQNTSYNSSMSNRGSITKVLLLRHTNASPTRSPDACRRLQSPNLFQLSLLSSSNCNDRPHENVESSHVSKETVV